ncbi:hypothetical protein AVEN_58544-1 [Araneus ventricosus]|uniref:Uncharacterized protein n=1 Tax=Araneus ventricosus TaxID=182803 RepID=A0A4Y2NMR1_ARAVE|nr:hypothetical protein AVEN_58544-1 [Araneus ventricosus]
MEELMTNEIQETNEVETTSVTNCRALLEYVLHLKKRSREVDEHVVFRYEGEFFPEKIVSITESGVKISSMQRTLKSWKWSNQPDEMDYLWEDVAGHIGIPKHVCRRGFYAVPSKYIWDLIVGFVEGRHRNPKEHTIRRSPILKAINF